MKSVRPKLFKQNQIARSRTDDRFRPRCTQRQVVKLLTHWRLHENLFHGVEECQTPPCKYLKRLVDLVGIEPTTSSMPWKKHSSRRLIPKRLVTGGLVENGYIGRYFRPISGQIFNVQNSRAAWAGVHAARTTTHFGTSRNVRSSYASDWEPDGSSAPLATVPNSSAPSGRVQEGCHLYFPSLYGLNLETTDSISTTYK